MSDRLEILTGDCREVLKTLPDASVQTCVTSPPYFGLRDYGTAKWEGGDGKCDRLQKSGGTARSTLGEASGGNGISDKAKEKSTTRSFVPYRETCGKCGAVRRDAQIGLEPSPAEYVANLVSIFREVRRTLNDDGTLWLNLGDCYANDGKWGGHTGGKHVKALHCSPIGRNKRYTGLKPKDLIGIPWKVAFALQEDGWFLRSDIIWAKRNPMPESVTDRPTRSHEYIFLLSKSARYYYDAGAIREPASPALIKQVEEGYNGSAVKDYLVANVQDASAVKSRIIAGARKRIDKQRGHGRRHSGFNEKWDALSPAEQNLLGANKRDVWTVAPANFKEAHFATFPPDLIKPCILAGCPSGGLVLDPFGGSGTTGMVALELGRRAILIELNPDYARMAEQRCHVTPGLPLGV